jgi:hypothetical protein
MTQREKLDAELERQRAMTTHFINQPNPLLVTIFFQQVREANLQQIEQQNEQ